MILNKFLKALKFIVFLMMFFASSDLIAQATMSKSLPQPQFTVLGIETNDFPKLDGNWSDTIALINYGVEIDKWIQKNISTKQQIIDYKNSDIGNQINTIFFKSLNVDEKTKFKEVAHLLSYIIIGQKNKMLNEYLSHQNSKKSKKDFYNEVEQIYFIHQYDLNFLLKQIK